MHDPMIVAFDVKSPFRSRPSKFWPDGYRNTVATVWHVDPERDGSDDSCGWSRPHLSKDQRDRLKWLAWEEARTPWFQRVKAKENNDPLQSECLLRAAVLFVARAIGVRVSWDEASRWAAELTHCPGDNLRGSLCHLPGWHTNFEEDTPERREDTASSFFCTLGRFILREKRPWWRHPRWHVWHWRIQIHAVQNLKRWLFSRCAKCGKGFRWGYAPTSYSWNGTGPRWFRGEEGVFHHDCSRPADANCAVSVRKADAP